MRISRKLFAGFAIVISLAVIVGGIGIAGMQKLKAASLSMYEKRVVGLEYVGKASAAYKQLRLDCRQVVISGFYDDKKGVEDARKQFEESTANFRYWMNESCQVATTDELIKFHKRILELFEDTYLPGAVQIIDDSTYDMPDHNNKLYINVRLASIINVTNRIENLIIGLMDLNSALAEQTNIDNTRLTQRYMTFQALLLVSAVIVAALVTYYIIKSIAVPINESAKVLSEIAKGDFSVRVTGDYTGDLEMIKNSVNDTAIELSRYLDEKMLAERSAYESELEKARVEAASEAVFSSIDYAGRIQKNLLPADDAFKKAFSDYSVIWSPRDIVGGDIYWMKNFDEGAVLCVCDCTGHGTPGALLTMLVVSTFETVVNKKNCKDTAGIIWNLEKRLVSIFNVSPDTQTASGGPDIKDGCDLAVLFISRDGSVTISAGNTHVFICDGKEVTRIKGQKIFVGEGRIKSAEDVLSVNTPYNPGNKYYVASDGLFDQIGGKSAIPFGYGEFKRIILENHKENQEFISQKVWEAFEGYRGDHMRRDDFELITFKP